jgi:hypothetical protein
VVARHVEQPQSVARYQTSNNSGEGRQASFHLMLSFPASRTGLVVSAMELSHFMLRNARMQS